MKLSGCLSCLILTHNEQPNIGRVLERLRWIKEVLVVDSGSSDETSEIVRNFPNISLLHRDFDTFADQCNFGLSKITTPWVISLDADYVLSDKIIEEIKSLDASPELNGYRASFKYCIYGKSLSASLYPDRTILYKVEGSEYVNEGHGHRIKIAGPIRQLSGVIYHDDRKPLSRWLDSQKVYAEKEAAYLLSVDHSKMDRGDKLRKKILVAPLVAFVYTLFWKRCLFDGWRGWFYALQRTYAEILISLHLLDHKLGEKENG